MSGTFILLVGFLIGVVVAVLTFVFNSSTPLQLGPVPFFGGSLLAFVCFVGLIARWASGLK